jgi:hypothetical protein
VLQRGDISWERICNDDFLSFWRIPRFSFFKKGKKGGGGERKENLL